MSLTLHYNFINNQWYPGLITGSRLSPSQTQLTFTESPQLLYHVRFDDGVESYDLDTEDIMLFDQYQEWLKVLEQYYSLPVSERNQLPRLSKHTRVFAKWIDQTDPELYGSWMAGKVVNSKVWKDRNERRIRYHILFDNGDEDTKINDVDVVPEELYQSLLVEKVNRGRMKMNQSGLSGFDLIVEASKLSPVKTCTVRGSIDESDNESEDEDAFMAEFRCLEVLEQAVPVTPSKVLRLTRTQSPDVHYGVRMKFKPWIVEHITHNALQTVPSETSPP
jgi:hypothetical protein